MVVAHSPRPPPWPRNTNIWIQSHHSGDQFLNVRACVLTHYSTRVLWPCQKLAASPLQSYGARTGTSHTRATLGRASNLSPIKMYHVERCTGPERRAHAHVLFLICCMPFQRRLFPSIFNYFVEVLVTWYPSCIAAVSSANCPTLFSCQLLLLWVFRRFLSFLLMVLLWIEIAMGIVLGTPLRHSWSQWEVVAFFSVHFYFSLRWSPMAVQWCDPSPNVLA